MMHVMPPKTKAEEVGSAWIIVRAIGAYIFMVLNNGLINLATFAARLFSPCSLQVVLRR